MRHELTKLFTDQLNALAKHLGKDVGWLHYKYIATDSVHDVYVVYFNYDSHCLHADAIVFWSGWRINYQSINRPGLFIYEPEKSLKHECLKLISSIEGNLDYCLELKQECGRDAKKDLYKLKDLILEENT